MGKIKENSKGTFILNDQRWRDSGMGSTDETMYDCKDCTEKNIEHAIVEEPGPPVERNTQTALKGDSTTIRRCTGCNRQDGPWVPAEY